MGQAQMLNHAPFSIGERLEIKSSILMEDRTMNVYLPNSYAKDSTKKYPVIYVLDGSADEDFIHIAGLVQFCSFSWIGIIPESIVVGIGNVDRKRDFTYPSPEKIDQQEFPTCCHSTKFMDFLSQEL